MILQGLKSTVFFTIACVLAWRIVSVNLSEHYATYQTPEAARTALMWHSNHPRASFRQGLSLVTTDPDEAELFLHRAAVANPALGHVFIELALLRDVNGEGEVAEDLALTANRLAPVSSNVQLKVARYWARRGQLAKSVHHLDRALSLRPRLGGVLFPDLLKLAEDPQGRASMAALHEKMLNSWPGFFIYAAANAQSVDTVMVLYDIRTRSGQELTIDERQRYLQRLQREGFWREAYFAWLNQLGPTELEALRYLYNGDFELPVTQEGFGWQVSSSNNVLVHRSPPYDFASGKAIRIVFQGKESSSRLLQQNLFLKPGDYRLQGSVKPEGLEASRGVRWALRCLAESPKVFHHSEHFLGTSQWRTFATRFTVPDQGCRAQQLRLEVAGRFQSERLIRGESWFDDLNLVRLTGAI